MVRRHDQGSERAALALRVYDHEVEDLLWLLEIAVRHGLADQVITDEEAATAVILCGRLLSRLGTLNRRGTCRLRTPVLDQLPMRREWLHDLYRWYVAPLTSVPPGRTK